MIKVNCKDNKIVISGHANFADYGKDIVCASVSSIVTTSINAIYLFDSEAITYHDDSGVITIELLSNEQSISKLILNMFNMLKDLERQYPKNIKVEMRDNLWNLNF